MPEYGEYENGYFVELTILSSLNLDTILTQEEAFDPFVEIIFTNDMNS